MSSHEIRITVNGTPRSLPVAPGDLLIHVLREELELTGTKYGCGVGECGACTVMVGGAPVLACLTLAVRLDGQAVTTIEGLGAEGLDPLQEAFLNHSAVQCGFCTPGLIMTARTLLDQDPNPSEEDIRAFMRGNLCRCTGYAPVVDAIRGCKSPRPSPAEGR